MPDRNSVEAPRCTKMLRLAAVRAIKPLNYILLLVTRYAICVIAQS